MSGPEADATSVSTDGADSILITSRIRRHACAGYRTAPSANLNTVLYFTHALYAAPPTQISAAPMTVAKITTIDR